MEPHSEYPAIMISGSAVAFGILASVVKANRTLVEDALATQLPWLAWLPNDARTECVSELLDHLTAGTTPSATLLFSRAAREWQSTAEVHSDPELARRLSGPFNPQNDD
ncbi:hypothetical protein ACFXHA_08950 [Nocardia sp. NPDC059240]|uniref:hypothetical protein n=1 Tax=Nocardia sp. NPDC059240 TaxID=3346786 RepID=UPI0036ABD345